VLAEPVSLEQAPTLLQESFTVSCLTKRGCLSAGPRLVVVDCTRGSGLCGDGWGAALGGAGDIELWLSLTTWERILRLAALIGMRGAAYFVALFLLGIRPQHFRSA